MPTIFVKQYIAELFPLLTGIINHSIATGEFPQEWKTAFVVSLLKNAVLDPTQKYRPVSNFQYVSKLTERAIVNQLRLHSDCRFPLPPSQSAYRAGHSTDTAILKRFILTFF